MLQERFPHARVVALDLPGNGRLNAVPSPTSVQAMTECARRELLAQGLEPPYKLLAMSLGAMVAIAWATEHMQEVTGAVLVNTSVGIHQPFYRRLKPAAWLPLLCVVLPGASSALRERIIMRLTSHRHASAAAAPAEWIAARESHPVSRRNAWRQLLAALRFRSPHRAPQVPMLVLSGERDRLVDPRCSRALAELWHTDRAQHPDAGHDIAFDDAEWLVRQIGEWQP